MSNGMIKALPLFMRKSKVFNEIFDTEDIQFDLIDLDIEDLRLQMDVDTATWGLAVYEKELGITVDTSKPVSERRSVIKSKMRGTGQVDAALIKLVADSYANGDVDVSFDGSINITFTSVVGIPPNIEDLEEAIEEIQPAHLSLIYIFLYNTHQKLSEYTHQYLSAFTQEDVRSTDLD